MIREVARTVLPRGLGKAYLLEFQKETHINRAMRALNGHTYLEIGVAEGYCFRRIAASRKIGVDPSPGNFADSLSSGESIFRMTSDAFFAQCAGTVLAPRGVDVAFVDGLHSFSQALSDILNLENFMARRGVIFLHDCNPPTQQIAEGPTAPWTGDVWKCAYYLRRYRSDLRFFTLDCDWGLGVLTGFGRVPGAAFPGQDVLRACSLLDYSLLIQDRKKILRLRPVWYSCLFFGLLRRLGLG